MEKRKFTIHVPKAGKTDFNRLSTSLKRHLTRAFPEDPPAFSCPVQPKTTLHLTVKPKQAGSTLAQITKWCKKNPEFDLFIDGKLHKIVQKKTGTRPPKRPAKPSEASRRIPDQDFVEEAARRFPERLPNQDFVLEAFSNDTPSLISDDDFVDEEE
jgi:hypothetical protein